jgi:4,5-dihydroxyphthalate decarboxylase
MSASRELSVLLGTYPLTAPLKRGSISAPTLRLTFADINPPSSGFKRTVRDLAFDASEIAIMTFLLARAHGKPLLLLPAVVMARPQYPFIIYNRARGALAPGDLAGRRIAIRSYSVTTTTWLRGVLCDDYGVDPRQVTWVTFEEPHVAEFHDPPNVVRGAAGETALSLLLDGKVDAAIVADAKLPDDRLARLFPDPAAEDAAWRRRHGAMMVNHMVAVKEDLARTAPEAVRDFYRLLLESRQAAGLAPEALTDHPFGFRENRRNLEVAIDYAWRQGLLPRRLEVDDLYGSVVQLLDADGPG